MDEITESIERAFDRIRDFEIVQAGAGRQQMLAAVELLQESVGIGEEARTRVAERLDRRRGPDRAPGHVLLGMIVGLMAAELEAESRSRQVA